MIFIVVILCLIASYFIPVWACFRVRFDKSAFIRLKIYGFIPINFGPKKEEEVKVGKTGESEKKKKSRINVRRIVELVFDGGFWKKIGKALKRLLLRIIFSFRLKIFSGQVAYGSDDPAKTAKILGHYYALRYSLTFIKISDQFTLEPDFVSRRISGTVEGRVAVYPAKIIAALLLFLFDWPIWKTVSIFRK